MEFSFNHFNFNVFDLERSIAFYKEALDLDVLTTNDQSDLLKGQEGAL